MKMSDNPTKYEVLIEQYLRSILDISDFGTGNCEWYFGHAVHDDYNGVERRDILSANERGRKRACSLAGSIH